MPCVASTMSSQRVREIYDFRDEENGSEVSNERTDDEDTEDASETDTIGMKERPDHDDIREQVYRDKLRGLYRQLKQLENGTLPEYQKRLKKLEQLYHWTLERIDTDMDLALERAERDYKKCKSETAKEFEEKKIELKENLVSELEEKKLQIKSERLGLELTGDSMEVKPITTRKLRRRPHDPLPLGGDSKRRRQSPTNLLSDTLSFQLDDHEILDDLKLINRGKGGLSCSTTRSSVGSATVGQSGGQSGNHSVNQSVSESGSDVCDTGGGGGGGSGGGGGEVRLEDGKLRHGGTVWSRGHSVQLEAVRDRQRVAGVICAIGTTEVWVRRSTDNSKIRITLSQLNRDYRIIM